MSLTISIDKKNFYSVFTLLGEVSFDDFRAGFEYISHHPPSFRRMPRIWDFRRADLSKMHRPQIEKIAAYVDQKAEVPDIIRIACVVGTDLQYGLSRMLQFYMDQDAVELKIFKDLKVAIKWANEIKFMNHPLPFHMSPEDSPPVLRRKVS